MIEIAEKTFRLSTDHTAYLFRVTDFGHLEHLHYGGPVSMADGAGMAAKTAIARGSSILYDESSDTYCLDDLTLEWSGVGKGDFRNPPAELTLPDGTFTNDFVYVSHERHTGALPMETLPTAYGEDAETLVLHLKEKAAPVTLDLIYTVYPREDVIARRCVLKNGGETPIVIDKLMSYMLDMVPAAELTFTTFDGAWIREARRHDRPVASGIYVNEGSTGASGHKHNPGVLLSEAHCSEEQGRCWGFNLLYSGNHYTAVEKTETGLVRVMAGISPRCFRYTLAPGAVFETPEGVMTYSDGGFNGRCSATIGKPVFFPFGRGSSSPWPSGRRRRALSCSSWTTAGSWVGTMTKPASEITPWTERSCPTAWRASAPGSTSWAWASAYGWSRRASTRTATSTGPIPIGR